MPNERRHAEGIFPAGDSFPMCFSQSTGGAGVSIRTLGKISPVWLVPKPSLAAAARVCPQAVAVGNSESIIDAGKRFQSSLTVKLVYGAAKSAHRAAAFDRLRELVQWLPALALPESAAEAYGTIRAGLAAKGEMIGNNDLWIAAHALAAKLTLVTNNEREFQRVPSLKLQNWAG
jgi:tRNA(fMet)-specific endonuclease VapC